jgi:hypothetical protein
MIIEAIRKQILEHEDFFKKGPRQLYVSSEELVAFLWDEMGEKGHKQGYYMGEKLYYLSYQILTVEKPYRGLNTVNPILLKTIFDLLTDEQVAILLTDPNEEIRELALLLNKQKKGLGSLSK